MEYQGRALRARGRLRRPLCVADVARGAALRHATPEGTPARRACTPRRSPGGNPAGGTGAVAGGPGPPAAPKPPVLASGAVDGVPGQRGSRPTQVGAGGVVLDQGAAARAASLAAALGRVLRSDVAGLAGARGGQPPSARAGHASEVAAGVVPVGHPGPHGVPTGWHEHRGDRDVAAVPEEAGAAAAVGGSAVGRPRRACRGSTSRPGRRVPACRAGGPPVDS